MTTSSSIKVKPSFRDFLKSNDCTVIIVPPK
jgi:hypothetical protein